VQIDPLEAEVSGVTPGAFARLRVSDDGEGMPPEVVAKAFEPFFTTKETGRGTGLGLAMVYGIVKRWSGDAVIASRPGAGTTVSLIFPLSDEVPAAPVAAPERAVRHGDRDVVLLVEDQEGVRESTARILSAAGYQVLQAENAMKAAQMYAESAVDILVTDIIMPQGVSGKELADYLQLAQPDLPVLFISGYSVQTMEDRGILTSSINLLAKPFTPEDLLEAVAAALTERVALLQ